MPLPKYNPLMTLEEAEAFIQVLLTWPSQREVANCAIETIPNELMKGMVLAAEVTGEDGCVHLLIGYFIACIYQQAFAHQLVSASRKQFQEELLDDLLSVNRPPSMKEPQ